MQARITRSDIWAAALLSIFSFFGCRPNLTEIHNPTYQLSADSLQTTEQKLGELIKLGCLAAGWQVVNETPQKIYAEAASGGHSATVAISYDAAHYTIEHFQSSPGLQYQDGIIHYRYNFWVDRLDRYIRQEITKYYSSLVGGDGAQQSVSYAEQILARSKEAAGGATWDAIKTTCQAGKISASGLNGAGEFWADNLTGRYAEKYDLGPVSGADGFDGKTSWSQDSSGQSRPEEGGNARQASANEAYRQAMAYWFKDRWPATIEFSGENQEQGRAERFFVLQITPWQGRPFELWINAETYLLDHIVEKADIETRSTYYSDYREVKGVKVPFAARSTNGEAKYDQFITLEKIQFNAPIDDAKFAMPVPPPPDYVFAHGKTSTTVPFELINNHIYLKVKLNGKGPFLVLCDTGGANIVGPDVVSALQLNSEGALQGRGVGEKSEDIGLVKIKSLEVGDVTLSDQLFAVMQNTFFKAVEDVAATGLIGYEVFKRFVVKIDYEHSKLTLTEPSAFSHRGSGVVVPFQFNGHVPEVDGDIDGIAGKFDIDTGSRASIDLLAPFVEKHDLKNHYDSKLEAVTGWGVGGPARAIVTRAKSLRLGKVEVKDVVTELSLQKEGAFASPYTAGNVGGNVLKRFNVIFDYPHQQLIFEQNKNFGAQDIFDRSGMWLNRSAEGFEAMDVTADGPAAEAGIKAGDKILAVDGRDAKKLALPKVRLRFKTDPPGKKLKLKVQSGDGAREVVLVLEDLI